MDDPNSMQISLSPDVAKGSSALKAIFLLNFLINAIGTTLHCGLILVTVRNRRFHSTCNLLIAANSFCTVLAYLLVLCPLWLLLAPNIHLRLLACFGIQLVPLFATFHVFSLMLAIGFDRLLSTFWALWYVSRNDRGCLGLLLAVSASFPLFITSLAFANVMSKPNAEKLCTLGDILGRQSSFVSLCCLVVIVLSVCCYSLVWIRLKRGIQQGQFDSVRSRQPIFRSLCIILCVQVGGWTFGQLAYAAIYFWEQRINPLTRWELNSLVLCFLSLAAALDVPVLYTTSVDYRHAFHRQFPFLTKLAIGPSEKKRTLGNLGVGREQPIISSTRRSRSPVVVNPRF